MRNVSSPGALAARWRPLVGCAVAFGLALTIVATSGRPTPAQEVGKGPPAKPQEVFQQFKQLVGEGKYDLAATFLQLFLDSKPTETDYLELEKRYKTPVFSELRTIPKWSEDPKTEKQARDNVEEVIKQATAITTKLLRNPERVQKFIRNLGETFEEQEFAKVELQRTGDYAVPFMFETYRQNVNPKISKAILATIPIQDSASAGAWLAGLDGLTPEQQTGVILAITARTDALTLINKAQTDFIPYLLRFAGSPETPASLRTFAVERLEELRGLSRITPDAALVKAAKVFADHKAIYADAAAIPDARPSSVPLWTWVAGDQKLVKLPTVAVGQADEYYGLRYAKWALGIRPDSETAQALILSIAADSAMERGKFGTLARTDPAVYQMLAQAPLAVLTDLLQRSLFEKNTGLALAVTQVLGDRSEKGPAVAPKGKVPLLGRALDYPDPRVQFAAANALLRAPVPVDPALKQRVIEVLKRAAAVDQGAPDGAKGKALVADPNRQRADAGAAMLRGLGYDVEIFANGRDLLRRIARASDFDLLMIDHHVPNPELGDLVSQLRADLNTARRPVLVVASADIPIPPSLDQLLLRLAVLIAATESDPVGVPNPFVPSLRQAPEVREAERARNRSLRDAKLLMVAQTRVDRLRRLVDTAGLELTPAQTFQLRLRAEQVTYAALAAEYPITSETAPETVEHIALIQKQIATQPSLPPSARRVGVDHLISVIQRLELDVAKAKHAQDRYDLFSSRVDAESLGLVVNSPRDPVIEARVTRLVRGAPGVRVIPEPYSRTWFEVDVNAAFADPADRPRDPAEKKATAKQAVTWLSKMASGEVTGFDVKPAAPELLAALRIDDLTDAALDGVAALPTAEAQQALISLALTVGRPLQARSRAADAAIRHIQVNGKLTPESLAGPLATQSGTEPDPDLRGKFLVLKRLLSPAPADYLNGLRSYTPPLVPPAAPAPKPDSPPGGGPAPKPNEKD